MERERADVVEVCRRENDADEWEVWAIDGDGAIVTAIFAGPGAETRAEEYAIAKYGEFERRAPGRQDVPHYRRSVVRLVVTGAGL